MPRVDFYLLDHHTPDGKLRAVCRLSQKIYSLGQTALIQTPDEDQARTLDDLMWTFDQSSFIPHGMGGGGDDDPAPPITIDCQPRSTERHNVLISLLEVVPEHYSQYERIAEFVDDTPDDKAKARDRFRFYREAGCALKTHDIHV